MTAALEIHGLEAGYGRTPVLHGLDPNPSRALQLAVLIAASLTATVTRYVAMRTWVFSRARRAIRPSLDLASR